MSKAKRSTWKLYTLTAALVGYVGFSSYAVLALFTDSQTVGANTFTTGTINLTATPATAAISFSNMAPGDVTAGAITVANPGSLDYRYAVTSSTSEDPLAAQIDLTIRIEASTGACTATSTGTPVLYTSNDLGSMAGINVIGDPATGSQAGDRTLTNGTNEVLCFQVALPLTTGNAFQGLSTTASFAFNAEQTVNNP